MLGSKFLRQRHSGISISSSCLPKFSDDDTEDLQVELQKRRSNNTLCFDRQIKSWSLPIKKKPHYDLEQSKMDFLSFLAVIESNDSDKIVQLSDEIAKRCVVSKDYFSEVISSLEAMESFTNVFVSATSQEMIKSMISALSSMFPLLSSKIKCAVVDCGIANKIYDQFSPITDSILQSINLIITVSKFSSYGRNSFLGMGIHELLITTAMETNDLNISIGCCVALQSIFENPEKVDCDYVENYISAIVKLLDIQNEVSQNAILRTLCAIANQMPSVVNCLIAEGMHTLVLHFLKSPGLQSSSLCLVSKLCYTNDPLKIKEMVDNGLFEILFNLILTDHSASVLHVFYRICEKLPNIIPNLPPTFIKQLIEICHSAPFSVIKEAALLLTILIARDNKSEIIHKYMNQEIIEILVDMLSSSQNDIILHCLIAIKVIVNAAETTSNMKILIPMLNETDFFSSLSNLEENANNNINSISNISTKLLERLNSY